MRTTGIRSGAVRPCLTAVISALVCSLTLPLYAQTWSGGGSDDLWSDALNWTGGVPQSAPSTALTFTGSNNLSSFNDLSNLQLNSITFDAAASVFNLSGNSINFVSNGGTLPTLTVDSTNASPTTISNALVLTDNLTIGGTGGGGLVLSGVVSGASSLTLSGGFVSLSNSGNSFSGGTIVTGGTLQLGADNALPSGGDLSVTGATAAAVLDLNGHAATVGNINLGDGSINAAYTSMITDTSVGSTGLLTLNGNITFNPGADMFGNNITPPAMINSNLSLTAGQHVIDNNGDGAYSTGPYYDVVIGGLISGSGGLSLGSATDNNTGLTVALTHAANTYSGPTNVIYGGLYLGAANALPMRGAVTVANTGSLYLYIASDQNQPAVTPGSYNQTIGSLADAPNSGHGSVYLGGATLTVGTDNTSTTFSGQILDNDSTTTDPTVVGGSLVKVGTGTLTLSGSNAYTGSTTVSGGTLQLGASNALPLTTNLTLNAGALDMNGHSQTLAGVTNQGGTVLVHGGTSTLSVSGAYSQSAGATQVDTKLNLTPGQDLNITAGQLVGTGTIGNATSSGTITVTNSGGTVRPGDLLPSVTTGTLAVSGNYAQQAGGTLEIDIAGPAPGTNYDVLNVTGNASLGGTLDVKLLGGFAPTPGEQFNFLEYGTLDGGFSSVVTSGSPAQYLLSYANGVGTLTAVPEESSLVSAALLIGIGGLIVRSRRYRFPL